MIRVMNKLVISLLLALTLLPVAAQCQLVDEFKPNGATCCLPSAVQRLADQMQDWDQLSRYQADNAKLKAQGPVPGRVVFLGDSITDGWRLANYFPDKPYVNRGISGQTTPQMLVRFYPDVVELKPAAVIILAGTNDIARNTGMMTAEMIQRNLMAMADLAKANNIKMIFCSVTPVSDYRRNQTTGRPPADILKLNTWMRDYAAKNNIIYVDYFSAMADEKGFLKQEISNDGLHPTAAGYEIMAPLAASAIQKALQ
jgi:lysophospholipase L1-like esterase